MPAEITVRPQKWSNVIGLYDDGDYSAIWGEYNGAEHRCLGVRWNGSGTELGYPSQGGNPLWYVEPEFVTGSILLVILNKLESKQNRQDYIQHVLLALREWTDTQGSCRE